MNRLAFIGRASPASGELCCLSQTGAVGDATIGEAEGRGADVRGSGLCDGGVGWMLIAAWASSRWRMCGLRWSGR